MSKTRYFYTDPLTAAWMAKYHGMRFEAHFPATAQTREVKLPAIESHIGLGHLQIEGKFYILPASLYLLEPKHGDTLEQNDAAFIWGPSNGQNVTTARIIRRDGKAFHWPESEAA